MELEIVRYLFIDIDALIAKIKTEYGTKVGDEIIIDETLDFLDCTTDIVLTNEEMTTVINEVKKEFTK